LRLPTRQLRLPSPSLVALPLLARPHPLARTPLALSQSLSPWQAGPACQRLPRARDRASDAIAAGRHRPVVSPLLARLPGWRLAPLSPCANRAIPSPPCPSRPVVATVRHHTCRGELAGARHLSPPSSPQAPIKGPPELRFSAHQPRPLPPSFPELNRASVAAPFLYSGESRPPPSVKF
jgi:hypothetical protein